MMQANLSFSMLLTFIIIYLELFNIQFLQVCKNKYYFCKQMERQKKILFGIIFTIGILFFFGLSSYSKYNVQPFSIEFSAGTNNAENNFSSDNDFFDDDQINHTNELSSLVESISQIFQHSFLILQQSFSFWQPPKIS